jgi:hypothetical protein
MMASDRSNPAELVNDELEKLTKVTNPDTIAALSEAAEDDELWRAAQHDPRAFLEERRVTVPEDVRMTLIEAWCPDLDWGADECPPGSIKRCQIHSFRICARRVRICVGETCIQFCLKWQSCAVRVCWCDWIEPGLDWPGPPWLPKPPGEGGPNPNL